MGISTIGLTPLFFAPNRLESLQGSPKKGPPSLENSLFTDSTLGVPFETQGPLHQNPLRKLKGPHERAHETTLDTAPWPP